MAFEQLKLFLTKPPIMMVPQPDETLLIYIAATSRVVSTAIVVEREEVGHAYKVQRSVYFISEVLNESKTRYPQVQKLLYSILVMSRKLRHYFEYYKITMVTEFPLGDILRNNEANGRIMKWAIELSTYSIEFRSRPTLLLSGPRSKSPSPLLAPSTRCCTSTAPLTLIVLVLAFYSLC